MFAGSHCLETVELQSSSPSLHGPLFSMCLSFQIAFCLEGHPPIIGLAFSSPAPTQIMTFIRLHLQGPCFHPRILDEHEVLGILNQYVKWQDCIIKFIFTLVFQRMYLRKVQTTATFYNPVLPHWGFEVCVREVKNKWQRMLFYVLCFIILKCIFFIIFTSFLLELFIYLAHQLKNLLQMLLPLS